MANQERSDHEAVIGFWFGPLDEHGRTDQAHLRHWFIKDEAFDQEIRRRFGSLHEKVSRGVHEDWLATPLGRLAYLIVSDQFSRNMFRGTGRMFASDAGALAVAVDGIERGLDRRVFHDGRMFFYMPLMHAEDLAMQDRCASLFASWRDEVSDELRKGVAEGLKYAEMHRDIIRRFGRFPHRNAVLSRTSTPAELAFLKQPGSSF